MARRTRHGGIENMFRGGLCYHLEFQHRQDFKTTEKKGKKICAMEILKLVKKVQLNFKIFRKYNQIIKIIMSIQLTHSVNFVQFG